MIKENEHATIEAAGVIDEMKGTIPDDVYSRIESKIAFFLSNNVLSERENILMLSLKKLSELRMPGVKKT